MALSAAEEAQTRELLAQEAAILSLASNEATIISKLAATKVNLSQLPAASSVADADLLLLRQGSTDKSVAGSIVKAYASVTVADASETVKGIVEIATVAEAQAGTDTVRAVTPAGLAASSNSVVGLFSNLKAYATGLSSIVTVTADEIVVENVSNSYKTLRAVSLSIAGTSVGANALDAGVIAINAWYSLWVIWNGTTTAGLMSLSATAPALPSGYTHKARIGWVRTDGTANKYPLGFKQFGRRVQYVVSSVSNLIALPVIASGTNGNLSTPTWVSIATSNVLPTTSSYIVVVLSTTGSGNINLAPNNSYGSHTSATNPPALSTVAAAGPVYVMNGGITLESVNIYIASAAPSVVQVLGWEDNL
jgi:hypothetical protein